MKTNLTRAYGRGPTSERVVEYVPHGHWLTTTFVAALRTTGLAAPMVVDGAINGELFVAYVEQILAPTLRPGDVVVMDNLSSHKVAGVGKAIRKAGADVLYLPPYSPDLNPIEKMWSKVKALLRSAAARTKDALDAAIAAALAAVTADDCRGWFASCGYAVN